jgi:hypothetical protein
MATKPLALRAARAAAVLFALSVLGYLAYDAQRRANPPAHAGAQPNEPVLDTGVQQGPVASEASGQSHAHQVVPVDQLEVEDDYMYSSKSMPLILPGEDPGTEPFLSSSKSGVLHLPGEAVFYDEEPVESDPYLPSSKVLMLDLPEVVPPTLDVESVEPAVVEDDIEETP